MSPARRTPGEVAATRTVLVGHAADLVRRSGPAALTMRSLAHEAGCSVGLVYKVFEDRGDLVGAVVEEEMGRLRLELEGVVASAGGGTVGGNLGRWADALLGSPAVALAHGDHGHGEVDRAVVTAAGETGIVAALEETVAAYLEAEKQAGRIRPEVDTRAHGFLVAGAVHNLVASGPSYPRPSRKRMRTTLEEVARALAPLASGGCGPG